VTTHTYDDLYHLVQQSTPGFPSDNFTYDKGGRMLTAERGGWLVAFAYDGANRVIQTTQGGRTISYGYNVATGTRTITYPGGRVITEQKDARDRLGTVSDSSVVIAQYSYDLGNRVASRAYGNGSAAAYTRNANNWITSLEHAVGGTRVAGFGHTFDAEGNKLTEEKRHDSAQSETYGYDALNRLVSYQAGSSTTTYNLDPLGNWNSKVKDGITETRTHNAANQITAINGVALSYDANGNLRQDDRFSYDYDEANRLVRATRLSDSQVVGEYVYDALGRRILKRANPSGTMTETVYLYDDQRVIEDENPAAATLASYVYGNYIDEVLQMLRDGQRYYYHQNSLWSVGALSDAAGSVVERYAYNACGAPTATDAAGSALTNAWGTARSAVGNHYLFTGREYEEETALYHYRARGYDPRKGRFHQKDPLIYTDDTTLNSYTYVRHNSVNRVDPSGLVDFTVNTGYVHWDGYIGFAGGRVVEGLTWISGGGKPQKVGNRDNITYTHVSDCCVECQLSQSSDRFRVPVSVLLPQNGQFERMFGPIYEHEDKRQRVIQYLSLGLLSTAEGMISGMRSKGNTEDACRAALQERITQFEDNAVSKFTDINRNWQQAITHGDEYGWTLDAHFYLTSLTWKRYFQIPVSASDPAFNPDLSYAYGQDESCSH
jgi:RHS repeat-associated protein